MKKTNLLIFIGCILFLYSCGLEEDPLDNTGEDHALSIVGIKDAFTYSFRSASAKSNTAPDEIHSLTVKIVNDNNDIVYEQWYYDWSDSTNQIPDSIYIPALGAGNYKIYASTTDHYYYYDDYYYAGNDPAYGNNFIIEPWSASTNPIYVGNQAFTIDDQDLEITLEMVNISAKLTVNYSQRPPNSYVNAALIGPNAYSYSFDTDDFFLWDEGYEHYTDLYQYDESQTTNYYFLPRTLASMRLYVYDYNNDFSIEQSFSFDQAIEMNVGDVLTININVESLMEGLGDGTLYWEAIEWNSLGEITID
ncbi:MAG: hypothetical protein JXR07_12215 [Reichenbachiella sp.]